MRSSKKRFYIAITAFTLLGFIFLPVFMNSIIAGYTTSDNLYDKANWMGFLGSYLGSIIAGIFTVLAVLLSFEISKEHAESALIKENALIVYYDLVLGLKDLLRVHGAYVMSAPITCVPTKMFFSEEWIKNVSSISSIYKEMSSIEKLYLMYGDLEMLNTQLQLYSEFTSNGQAGNNLEKLRTLSSIFVEKYFNPCDQTTLESAIDDQSDIMDLLKDEYKKLLLDAKNKIEVL